MRELGCLKKIDHDQKRSLFVGIRKFKKMFIIQKCPWKPVPPTPLPIFWCFLRPWVRHNCEITETMCTICYPSLNIIQHWRSYDLIYYRLSTLVSRNIKRRRRFGGPFELGAPNEIPQYINSVICLSTSAKCRTGAWTRTAVATMHRVYTSRNIYFFWGGGGI